MNDHEQLPVKRAQAALEKFIADFRVARATELAKSGRYLEAEGVLAQNGNIPTDPRELDLLARIAGQKGQFEKAISYWTAARQNGLEEEAYACCIRGIEQVQDTVLKKKRLTAIAFVSAAIATGVGTIFLFWPARRTAPAGPPAQSVQPTAVHPKSEPSLPPIVFKLPPPSPKPDEK